ncbi:hypothetical protein KQI72_08115 [Eubacterium sp. MSJ-21]|nr:hypothetical protein [Eubacterium sp. MSJ-21]
MSDQEKSTNNEQKASTDTTKEIKKSQSNESVPEDTKETESEKDSKDAKPAVNTEDNLELHSLSFRDRQRAKRARLKEHMDGMSKGQKFGYILSYYKGKIILGLILLAICIAIPVTIYKKSRPVALSYCIVNAPEPSAVDTSFVDEYLDFYNLNGAYQLESDVTVHLDKDTYLEEYSQNSSASIYTELPMLCFNGYYDVMIMDEKGLEYCAMQEIIYPLRNYLPAEIYSEVESRICSADDNDGVNVPFAIDISDTDFAKGLKLGYDKVYLGFPGNTERNYINAKRMLKFILHLDIDTETTYQ